MSVRNGSPALNGNGHPPPQDPARNPFPRDMLRPPTMEEVFSADPKLLHDIITRNQDLLHNATSARLDWLQGVFGGMSSKRDVDRECDFPKNPSAWDYLQLYRRDAYARRVVELYPKETWQVQPEVYEEEDGEVATEFERAWDDLGLSLRGEGTYFMSPEGNPVWEYLLRADVLCGIGQYAVIFLGLDDGLDPSLPAAGWTEQNSMDEEPGVRRGRRLPSDLYYGLSVNAARTKGRKLKFLQVFPETAAPVSRFELNPTSPRYGMPVEYELTLNPWQNTRTGTGSGSSQPSRTLKVHWSRVVHVADNLESSEVFGTPRMEPVLNNLLSIRKVICSGAEGYWRSAFSILSAETDPALGGEVKVNAQDVKEQLELMQEGLKRMALLRGLTLKTVTPTVLDPKPHVEVHEAAICVALACPVPVFRGYEIGEQASTNNFVDWKDRVKGRQGRVTTPRLIVPVTDRLIGVGVLPAPGRTRPTANLRTGTFRRKRVELYDPYEGRRVVVNQEVPGQTFESKGGYSCFWPDIAAQTPSEKADILLKKTQAYNTYASGGMPTLVPPHFYMTGFDDMTDEEAEAVIEAGEEHKVELEDEQIESTLKKVEAGVMPDPAAPPAPPGKGPPGTPPPNGKPPGPPKPGTPPPKVGAKPVRNRKGKGVKR